MPLSYEGDAIRLISDLKFKNSLRAARTLAHAIAVSVKVSYEKQPLPEALIPTPMSWRRHFVRGYNQTDRLAQEQSRTLRIPFTSRLKRRHGPTQHGRSRSARQTLPANTFRFTGNPLDHVALVDDVMTTGTTMKAIAQTCARSGIRRIDLWVACRTPEE